LDITERQVIAIVSRITKVPDAKLSLSTDLKAELNVDSLQGLQIVAALENQFGVTIPDDELDMYTSVGSIVETIKRLRPGA
jgi:acyl carrier protein